MLHFKKIGVLGIATLLFVSTVFTAHAQEPVVFTVGTVNAAKGQEITVPISVSAESNIGFLQFEISYDSEKLEMIKINRGDAGAESTITPNLRQPGTAICALINATDIKQAGDLVQLVFSVKQTAADGKSNIDMVVTSVGTSSFKDLTSQVHNGSIVISSSSGNNNIPPNSSSAPNDDTSSKQQNGSTAGNSEESGQAHSSKNGNEVSSTRSGEPGQEKQSAADDTVENESLTGSEGSDISSVQESNNKFSVWWILLPLFLFLILGAVAIYFMRRLQKQKKAALTKENTEKDFNTEADNMDNESQDPNQDNQE